MSGAAVMPDDAAIPVINLGGLYDPSRQAAIAAEIGHACRDVGFFYVSHAPVPEALRAGVFEAAQSFFAAPATVKEAVSIHRSPHNRGYVGLGREALDPARGADAKEAFNVGLDLAADDPEVVAGRPFRGPNLWPDLPGFRDTLLSYYDAMLDLGRALHRLVALDLGLEAGFFDDRLRRPLATLRLLHYPARAGAASAGALGAGTHTDYGNLTLLATDAVGGLEVKRCDGRWLSAPPIPGTFICNIGDCLMRWTNRRYVSTPHRVVSPGGQARYSVAFFLDADPDVIVEPLHTCVDSENPARYAPVTVADYLRTRLDATYGL